MPDEAGREAILKVLLKRENVTSGFDYHRVAAATAGYSGSDLKVRCVVVTTT